MPGPLDISSNNKFGRNYKLTIAETSLPLDQLAFVRTLPGIANLTFELPLTIEFDINRSILSSANTSTIRIYNISKQKRDKIYKDMYTTLDYRGMELKAGYGNTLSTVFKGNIKQAWSVREGVNYITTIEGYDAGFAFVNSKTSLAVKSGTPLNSVLSDIVSTMRPTVTPGVTSTYTNTSSRGNSYSANSAELLQELSDGAFYVDLEKAYILKDNDCIQGTLATIKSSTGLLGTPRREGALISFEMVFEPRLLIGQLVVLNSITNDNFNGSYKVMSVHHRGTISDAVSGDAVTTVGLWKGTAALNVLIP